MEERQQGVLSEVDRAKLYGMTGGSIAREQELMKSLQILLEKVEKGQFAMPGEPMFYNNISTNSYVLGFSFLS